MLINKKSLLGHKIIDSKLKQCRYQYIQITTSGETIATDGAMAILVTPQKNVDESDWPVCEGVSEADAGAPEREIYITKRQAQQLSSNIPTRAQHAAFETARLVQTPDATLATTTDMDITQTLTIKNTDVSYPANIDEVIPKGKPLASVLVDPKRLKQICEIVSEMTKDNDSNIMKIELYDENKPIKITADSTGTDQKMTALLMPVLGGGK
ncbi:MAG: hypothetical protein DRZ76_01740 [Candidatus Nealsonbacteria bacterium]|nr:MAG: hypothetical protein DRZ76_01740 [Candidatus Nealsonbacteria bacterium]